MQKRNEITLNRILDSAEILFSSKDFYEVKIEDIAKQANVGKGTVYTYFKSKEELMFKCLVNNIDSNHRVLENLLAEGNDFKVTLYNIFKKMYEFFQSKGPLIQQFMSMGPRLKLSEDDFKYLRARFVASLNMMTSFFQKGIDEGVIVNSMTPRQIAIIFQKMFDFNVIFTFYGEPEMSVEECYNFFTKTFFRQE